MVEDNLGLLVVHHGGLTQVALAAEPGEAGGDTAQVREEELYMTCELLLCHPPGADEEDEVEDGEEGDGDGGHVGVALLAEDDAEGIGVGGLAGGDEGDVFDYSQHRWFGPGLTNARIIFIPEDRKQFAYLGPGVGSLAQPPGGAVGGDGEAAGVVAVLGGEDRSAG